MLGVHDAAGTCRERGKPSPKLGMSQVRVNDVGMRLPQETD